MYTLFSHCEIEYFQLVFLNIDNLWNMLLNIHSKSNILKLMNKDLKCHFIDKTFNLNKSILIGCMIILNWAKLLFNFNLVLIILMIDIK